MTKRIYKAAADLACGAQIQERGTLQQCVRWCEEVLKANGGEITITIRDTGEMEFDDKE